MASGPADVLLVRLFVCCSTSSAVNVQLSLSSAASGAASCSRLLVGLGVGSEPVPGIGPEAGPEVRPEVRSGAARGGGTLLSANALLRLSSDCA